MRAPEQDQDPTALPPTVVESSLLPGDRIKFFVYPDVSVVILPKPPASTLKGIVPLRRKWPASIEEMHEAVASAATNGAQRSRQR